MVEVGGEISNFVKVWSSALISLTYCYAIGKLTPKGISRLLAILPIIALFLSLPLNLTAFPCIGLTSFFLTWLANFKLLLFAFGQGPLCSDDPPISLPHFLALSSLPIKFQDDPQDNPPQRSKIDTNPDQKTQNYPCPSPQIPPEPPKSARNYIIKALLWVLIILFTTIFEGTNYIHPRIFWLLYFLYIYFALEVVLAIFAKLAKSIFHGFEIEPQFNEPLLSTSLQDFWGKRWNLMVTRILRPTVYLPALSLSSRAVGRKWAPLPSVMATFLVSAFMHELIFYHLGRTRPTWEVTWFFVVHGLALCLEIVAKRAAGGKWGAPRWVSGPLTASFVVVTGSWLFLPPLLRAGFDTRLFGDYAVLGAFVRRCF